MQPMTAQVTWFVTPGPQKSPTSENQGKIKQYLPENSHNRFDS